MGVVTSKAMHPMLAMHHASHVAMGAVMSEVIHHMAMHRAPRVATGAVTPEATYHMAPHRAPHVATGVVTSRTSVDVDFVNQVLDLRAPTAPMAVLLRRPHMMLLADVQAL